MVIRWWAVLFCALLGQMASASVGCACIPAPVEAAVTAPLQEATAESPVPAAETPAGADYEASWQAAGSCGGTCACCDGNRPAAHLRALLLPPERLLLTAREADWYPAIVSPPSMPEASEMVSGENPSRRPTSPTQAVLQVRLL